MIAGAVLPGLRRPHHAAAHPGLPAGPQGQQVHGRGAGRPAGAAQCTAGEPRGHGTRAAACLHHPCCYTSAAAPWAAHAIVSLCPAAGHRARVRGVRRCGRQQAQRHGRSHCPQALLPLPDCILLQRRLPALSLAGAQGCVRPPRAAPGLRGSRQTPRCVWHACHLPSALPPCWLLFCTAAVLRCFFAALVATVFATAKRAQRG